MPATDPFPRCDILVLTWRHEVNVAGTRVDPLWETTKAEFGVPEKKRSEQYARGYDEVLSDLNNHKSHQEAADALWLLHPQLTDRFGEYYECKIDGRSICLFRSDLRLITDGPTRPVLRMLRRILEEGQPKLVLSLGIGGGTTPADLVSDVVVSTRARFRLRSDYAGSTLNVGVHGGKWQPKAAWLDGLAFPALGEPKVLPPSPNYVGASIDPLPATRPPKAALSEKPVLTTPRFDSFGFYWVGVDDPFGKDISAADMDAAPVAMICGSGIPCGLVLGVAVPALDKLEGSLPDGRVRQLSSVRAGWADYFFREYFAKTAVNCAKTAGQLCRVAELP